MRYTLSIMENGSWLAQPLASVSCLSFSRFGLSSIIDDNSNIPGNRSAGTKYRCVKRSSVGQIS